METHWVFLLKGPVADATDTPQPWRLSVQPYNEDEFGFFLLLHFNGAPVEWNDRKKQKYSEKYLSLCHFVNHKSDTDGPGIKSGPPR
jgi:hypothetical protein